MEAINSGGQTKRLRLCSLSDPQDTPSMANLLRAFLRGVFVRAVRWGIVEADPTRDIRPFKTSKRTRYITDAEFE